jgi:hypothetical protein
MPTDAFSILVVIALVLAVVSLVPNLRTWPALAVSVILLSVAVLIGRA